MKVRRVSKSFKIVGLVLFLIIDIFAVSLAIKHVNRTPESDNSATSVPTRRDDNHGP